MSEGCNKDCCSIVGYVTSGTVIGGVVGFAIGGVIGLNLCYAWQMKQDTDISFDSAFYPGLSIVFKNGGYGAGIGAAISSVAVSCGLIASCIYQKCNAKADEAAQLLVDTAKDDSGHPKV